jgi:hypothetical protein
MRRVPTEIQSVANCSGINVAFIRFITFLHYHINYYKSSKTYTLLFAKNSEIENAPDLPHMVVGPGRTSPPHFR